MVGLPPPGWRSIQHEDTAAAHDYATRERQQQGHQRGLVMYCHADVMVDVCALSHSHVLLSHMSLPCLHDYPGYPINLTRYRDAQLAGCCFLARLVSQAMCKQ